VIPEVTTEGGAQRPLFIYQTKMNQNHQEWHLRNIDLFQILAEICVVFPESMESVI